MEKISFTVDKERIWKLFMDLCDRRYEIIKINKIRK
jgi:hypothetical protein